MVQAVHASAVQCYRKKGFIPSLNRQEVVNRTTKMILISKVLGENDAGL